MIKWLALISMIIDHLGLALKSQMSSDLYVMLRMLGRLSYPLFVYNLVLGISRTSNLRNYFYRVFIFGIIAEVFQLMFYPASSNSFNIMFSMSLYILTYVLSSNKYLISWHLKFASYLLIACLAFYVDYSIFGLIMFVGLMKLSANNINFKKKKIYAILIILISFMPAVVIKEYPYYQLVACVSGLLMFSPSLEERIFSKNVEKWTFYIIYPLQWVFLSWLL